MEKALLLTFLGMGLVTYISRVLPLLGLSRMELPRPVLEWLAMVPAAVLSALLAQSLVVEKAGNLTVRPLEALVAVPCLLLAWRTRSMMAVVLTGMVLVVCGRLSGLG